MSLKIIGLLIVVPFIYFFIIVEQGVYILSSSFVAHFTATYIFLKSNIVSYIILSEVKYLFFRLKSTSSISKFKYGRTNSLFTFSKTRLAA